MKPIHYFSLVGIFMLFAGCVPGPVRFQEQGPPPLPTAPNLIQAEKNQVIQFDEAGQVADPFGNLEDPYGLFRKRREIPVERNKYEGSLWQGSGSFGNFMRDSRAQNPGDLLTVTDIQTMVTQFEEDAPAPQNDTSGDQTQDIFKIGEAERLQVHKAIETMTVKVAAVNRSGLMAVYGEKIEFKDSNNVRYVTQLTGYARPQDVSDENTIAAANIQSFKFKTDRKVKITNELRNKIIENIKNLNSLQTTNTDGTSTDSNGQQSVGDVTRPGNTTVTDANADAAASAQTAADNAQAVAEEPLNAQDIAN